MRREFLVERQGRQFVLYAGLLGLGHEQGLKSIRTHLIQIPTEENKRVAIVSATVILEADGKEREFHGLGDAAPSNVASAMVNCLIRLAETRAKARALRDAVNVGMAALEELGDDDIYEGAPERGYAVGNGRGGRAIASRVMAANRNGQGAVSQNLVSAARATSVSNLATEAPGNISRAGQGRSAESNGAAVAGEPRNPLTNPVTEAQIDAIRSLCRRRNLDGETAARERFGAETLSALTQAQASELIKTLQTEAGSGRSVSSAA